MARSKRFETSESPTKKKADRRKSIRKKKVVKKINFSKYIFAVTRLAFTLPNQTISVKAMAIMNDFVTDIFERLASTAAGLTKAANRRTLSVDDIKYAMKLILPGELSKYAIDRAEQALRAYKNQFD